MPSDDCLKKLYIEPTARCNLRCKMCFRNSWKNEIIGDMRPETFRKAMTTMPDSVETVFFGGMGEPLAHPDIVEMVRTASSLGKRVELLSNGTLLDARRTAELLDAGLDMLWLSIDALDDGRYAQIRRNSQLALVKEHIVEFNRQRARLDRTVRLGVAFVVMKSNAHELALLPYFSTYYKVNEVNISNVIPTDEHTASEVLYNNVVDWGLGDPAPMESSPRIHLPLMDWQDPAAQEGLRSLLSTSMCSVYLSGQRVSRAARHCRFIDEGMAFVKFDGHVSPCMSLLRNATLYWRQKQRETRSHFFGDLAEQGLDEIWNAPDYADFRRRVRNFEFSPCYRCSLCENWEQGLTDCYGNDAPTCGGCLWSEGVIKWTSMSAYLPLCSLAGAMAYWRARKGDSKKRIVATCAVFALVPVLNSAFYALNSSYYARWYYMPVLILCAMTACALEAPDTDLDAPARGIGWLMVATLAFAVVPVQDTESGSWSFGVLQNPGQFAAVFAFGLGGLLVYRFICGRWRGQKVFARRLLAATLAFACAFSVVHIGIGKFGQWNTDSDLVEEYTNALKLKEDLPAGDWRVDTYKTHDNLGLWLDKSCLQYFGSTAAPSILSFYPALGVKRDVRSEPELSNYALRGLLSVKYLLTTRKHQEDFLAEADEGWSYYDTRDGYLLYENENYVPMGFPYDYYLTESQYENTIKTTRSNLLMRALVLKDEDAETYSKYLQPLPEERLNDLYYDTYVEDCDARRATASRVFEMTNSGFHAEIDLTRENLVFFSVPYDDGFTAYVNGEQADIVEVDEGLMAVLCPAGTNRVDFVYQADGYSLSRTVTLAAIPVFAVYCGFWWDRKKRKTV